MDPEDLVTLKIEEEILNCSKSELIKHSDYFRAMFEGGFAEQDQNIITLKDVEANAIKIILRMIWDKDYQIEQQHILSVLQATCMLQFMEMKDLVLSQIHSLLSVQNCLPIWFQAEQLNIPDLFLQAKLMAMLEFQKVKHTCSFFELELDQVVNYLGNINLHVGNEYDVLEAILKWYRNYKESSFELTVKLLHCVDFTNMSATLLKLFVMKEEELVKCELVVPLLESLIAMKEGNTNLNCDHCLVTYVKSLTNSKIRRKCGVPCILADIGSEESSSSDPTVLLHDKYKRKRKMTVLQDSAEGAIKIALFFIDINPSSKLLQFKKLTDVGPEVSQNLTLLDGFKVLGNQQVLYLFGGEFSLGTGSWNKKLITYDTAKDLWKDKDSLPYARRHFETCICGPSLFIIGGTGSFRIIQDNMFWYCFKTAKWSQTKDLPCSGRQIKCCNFDSRLFLLNLSRKCGYIYSLISNSWSSCPIKDPDHILPPYSNTISLFCYKSKLYIKDQVLVELELIEKTLMISKFVQLKGHTFNNTESVLCDNILYTLYRNREGNVYEESIVVEAFNIETYESVNEKIKEICDSIVGQSLTLFNVIHPFALIRNDLINEFKM